MEASLLPKLSVAACLLAAVTVVMEKTGKCLALVVDVSAASSAMRVGLSFYVTEVRGPVAATPVGLLESLIL